MALIQPISDDAPGPKRWIAVKGVRRAVVPKGIATAVALEAAPSVPELVHEPVPQIADPTPGPDRRERPAGRAFIRLPRRTRALRLVLTKSNGRRRWAVDVLVRQADPAVVLRGPWRASDVTAKEPREPHQAQRGNEINFGAGSRRRSR